MRFPNPRVRTDRRFTLAHPDLERSVEAYRQLRGHRVTALVIRDDCRQVRFVIDDGRVLMMSVQVDPEGRAWLSADILGSALAEASGAARPGHVEVGLPDDGVT